MCIRLGLFLKREGRGQGVPSEREGAMFLEPGGGLEGLEGFTRCPTTWSQWILHLLMAFNFRRFFSNNAAWNKPWTAYGDLPHNAERGMFPRGVATSIPWRQILHSYSDATRFEGNKPMGYSSGPRTLNAGCEGRGEPTSSSSTS